MRNLLVILAVVALLCSATASAQKTAYDLTLWVTDGIDSVQLHFGTHLSATEGIDAGLGEAEQPPLPPNGIFDARFVGDSLGQGVLKDFRKVLLPSTDTHVYQVKYQTGSGTSIRLRWDLPVGITGLLQDLILGTIINIPLTGKGSYVVTNPGAIPQLKLTMTYVVTGIHPAPWLTPSGFHLSRAFPNPFNPSASLRYSLPERMNASLRIYDIQGKLAGVLVDGVQEAGEHEVRFEATGLSSGMYFCRMQAGTFTAVERLLLQR